LSLFNFQQILSSLIIHRVTHKLLPKSQQNLCLSTSFSFHLSTNMTPYGAAHQMPEYVLCGIELGGDNHVEMAVLVHGRHFHIEFRATDLREPDQSTPTTFEDELIALIQGS
jgi:hypothetical protein